MDRRTFLTGAAALAAAPMLPSSPAAAPVPASIASEPAVVSRYAGCLVHFERGVKLFDADGMVRVCLGAWPDGFSGSSAEVDFGRAIVVQQQSR